MTQMRLFGDDRDYFKHDLITWLTEKGISSLSSLVYLPMLTAHKDDGQEGYRQPDTTCNRSTELLDFINDCGTSPVLKSLEHWRSWYSSRVANYQTVEPVNDILFKHETRSEYWKLFGGMLNITNAMVFVDPDTGLETRGMSYMEEKGLDKYIFNQELLGLYKVLHPSSVLMIYQHLPRNAEIHIQQVERKLTQISRVCKPKRVTAYRENDLSFLLITKATDASRLIQNRLRDYCRKSKSRSKTLV
jgi:hypothetical protein